MSVSAGVISGPFSDVGPRVAGALAEAGVSVLIERVPGGEARRLEARATDLPGWLAQAAVGTRIEDDRGWIVLEVEPNQVRWRATHEALGRKMARLSG